MQKQCAGCGTIFDDKSGTPNPPGGGTIHGCCDECNAGSFRSNEVKTAVVADAVKEIPEYSMNGVGLTPEQEVVDTEKIQ